MKRLRLIRLGLGLATAGGRPAWIRLSLMACGFSVGTALLLSAMSIVPALRARDLRSYRSNGQGPEHKSDDILRVWYTPLAVGDLSIQGETVDAVGQAPIPPGFPRVPGPGEIFASEKLASLWSEVGPTLEDRLGGHLAGVIAPDGVEGPEVVALWIGKPEGVHLSPAQSGRIVSFPRGTGPSAPALDLGALLITVGIGSAIVLPIWLFVATATRVSSATRESRLAAIRLAGGTESQVRLFAGLESGVAAAIGTLLGLPLFFVGRSLLARGPIMDIQFYPSDLAPPVVLAIATLVGLPIAATAMSLSTMRRLIVSPLGVSRKVRRSHPGWRWAIVLVGGITLLAWCASQHDDLIKNGTATAGILVTLSLAATTLGLVGTAIWGSWALAHTLAPAVRSVSVMLGFRRIEADPSSIGRVVGGVALMIAMIGVMQSGLIAVEHEDYGATLADWTDPLPSTAMVVESVDRSSQATAMLQAVIGVRSVAWSEERADGAMGQKPSTAILETDGSPATLEAVRDAVVWSGEADTVGQLRAQESRADADIVAMRRGILTITLFLLGVSAATLLVALVDWVMERRRSLAVLSAIGVGASVIRRSLLTQVAAPVAIAALLGLAGAITVTALLYTAVEQPIFIAYRQLAIVTAVSIAIVLGVTALTTPWTRIARGPELLREA